MTIPLAHKAADRNSCQWSFIPYHHLLSIHAAQTFFGAVVASLAGQWEEDSCTFSPGSPAPRPPLQGSCSSPISAQSCRCSPSAAPPLTWTRVQRKANMPSFLANVEALHFAFLHSWSNPKPTQGTVTLLWPSTQFSYTCWYEDHYTSKHFKWLFPQ